MDGPVGSLPLLFVGGRGGCMGRSHALLLSKESKIGNERVRTLITWMQNGRSIDHMKRMDSKVNTVMAYVINTGLLTSIVAIAALVTVRTTELTPCTR